MEYLNKIQIRGTVGNIVKSFVVEETRVVSFSVATNYAYKDRDGNAVIETTWFNVRAIAGKAIVNTDSIKRGSSVYVEGRMRAYRYTCEGGHSRDTYEIIPSKVEVLDEESLTVQM